ncbi:MAG TPA: serine/threonine-protein kinase [Thermoanaerobaculia bacterium]|nr:serine/threonine-protein kinase [Thermoanaerobaculia bacterium]
MPPGDDPAAGGLRRGPSSAEEIPARAVASGDDHAREAVGKENGNDSGPVDLPLFNTGDELAERYRLIRFIAKGGMGEVYEAEDLTLHVRVALKTIRPEIATDRTAVDRFKREINVARKITHPNVSRLYDLGIHRVPHETLFLTMELLHGETLADRIVAKGRMSPAEALPVAEQIAAGLAAAHDCGIIHRDFKSANVMLVPEPSARQLRAVVTDFGLARPALSDEAIATISQAGAMMGTPAYMAPEQVEGRRLTPAADIYAFGIVLYEMVTGSRPFTGTTPMSIAVKRLTEMPVSPRQLVPSLDPVWETVILRCLERDPARRFQNALEVTKALREGLAAAIPAGAVSQKDTPTVALRGRTNVHPTVGRIGLISAVVLVAVLFSVMGWRSLQSRAKPSVTPVTAATLKPPVAVRPAVAVLGLRNNTGSADAAWLSTAISEMVSTDLAAGGRVRVASGQEIARVKFDLGMSEDEALGEEARRRVQQALNVDSLVLGSYTLIGDRGSRLLRIDLRLLDAASGNVLASSSTSGTELQLFDLVSRAGGALRAKLGVGALPARQAVEVAASVPSNPEAVRYYNEGLAKLRRLDAAAASELLTRATTADPKHPLTWSALSAAFSALGDEPRASEAAARAVALGGALGQEQKLQVEARLHEAAREWERAVEIRTTLWESFPDNLDYALELAQAQISAGKTKEALVTVGELRRLPRPLSADPRIDLAEARTWQETGDFEKQKLLARTAAAKGRTMGARALVARARMLEATALLALGDTRGTTAAVDEARSLFAAAGDKGNVARAVELTAQVVHRQGDLEGERRLLDRALAVHRELGDKGSIARVLANLGTVLLSQGRTAEAEKRFDESVATFRQIGAKFPAAVTVNSIGVMMFYRGDLAAAVRRYHESLALFSELGEKSGTAMALTNIAEVLQCRGELDEARTMHEEALAIHRASGDRNGTAYDLYRLGDIFAFRGELVAARDRYQQALAIQNEIGDKLGAAETRAVLAGLAVEEGRAAEAEKTARESEEILRTEGAAEQSVLPLTVLIDALVAQGKQTEARQVADRAWKTAGKSEDRRLRFTVAVSRARAISASGKPDDIDAAVGALEDTIAEASRTGFVSSELAARLALGEVELAAGRPSAKRRLAALEREAKAKGFGRVARRAAAGAA